MGADYVRQMLVANKTEQHYKQILESLCGQSGAFASECQTLVDTYYESTYQWLLNEFDAQVVCDAVGLCSASQDSAPLWTTLDASRGDLGKTLPISLGWTGGDEAAAADLDPQIMVSVAGESGLMVSTDTTCMLCQYTLHFIQQQLDEDATREQIENIVRGVCAYLPKNLAEECGDYIDAYGDQVIALLEQELDPSIICPELGLCPGMSRPSHHLNDIPCVFCEYAMENLKQLLGDRTEEEAVRNSLDQLCSIMPRSLAAECTTFVDQNAVEIMKLISIGIKPLEVCGQLGLCNDATVMQSRRPINELPAFLSTNELPVLSAANQLPLSRMRLGQPKTGLENRGQSKTCVLCEYVIDTLDKIVLDNSTGIEDAMRTAIQRVCMLMPMTLADDCLTFLEQYGDKLLHMLVAEEFSPQSVCQQLSLCQSQPILGMGRIVGSHLRYRRSSPTAGRSTPPAVGQHPESCKVCRAMKNSPDAPICSIAVEDIEGFTFDHCSAFDCSSEQCEPSQSPLIGSQKCTWGPAYFCGSQINAHECGGQSLVDMCLERRMGFGETRVLEHPESCKVCRAMEKSPDAPICEIAVQDIEGFTMEQCAALDCNKCKPERTESTPLSPPRVGQNPCTWGPAYWCDLQINAHECGGNSTVGFCHEKNLGFGAV